MKYRIFTGERHGHPDRRMAFEENGVIFQLKFLRDTYHPLKVQRLEDVTGASLGLSSVSHDTLACDSLLDDPFEVYDEVVKTLPALTPA